MVRHLSDALYIPNPNPKPTPHLLGLLILSYFLSYVEFDIDYNE